MARATARPPLTAAREWMHRHPFDAGFFGGALVSLALYLFIAQGGFPLSSRLGSREHYYTVEAIGMLHGRLWVPRHALTFECFMDRGHCYGYFGITPALLRLPAVALFGPGVKTNSFELVYFTLGFLTLAAAAWWLSRQLVDLWAGTATPRPLRAIGLIAGFAGLGATPLIFLASRPTVYEEAILWGVAFGLLALAAALSFWRRPRWSVAAVIVLADLAGICARPTTGASGMVATGILGLWLLGEAWRRRRGQSRGGIAGLRRPALLGMCLLAGAALAASSASLVSFAKFHTVSPPYTGQILLRGEASRIAPFTHFAGINGAVIPSHVLSTMLPKALKLVAGRPYVLLGEYRPIAVWPAHRGDLVWEPNSSVPDALPFSLLGLLAGLGIVGAAVWRWRKSKGRDRVAEGSSLVLLSGLAALVAGLAFPGDTYRYLADWLPVLVPTMVVALAWVAARRERWRGRAWARIAALLVGLALAAQVFIQLSLAVQSGLTTDRLFKPHCSGRLNPYGVVGTFFCPTHPVGKI